MSSQSWRFGATISNNVVAFPVTGVPKTLYSQIHPGLDLFFERPLNTRKKSQCWININTGVYYHQYFQTGIRLYGGLDYRYFFKPRTSIQLGFLAGYLHSITDYDRFELNKNGEYEKIPNYQGHPQFLTGIHLGMSYGLLKNKPDKIRLVFSVKCFLQGPFASSYIPILPTNALMLGFSMPLCKSNKTAKP